MEHPDHYDRRDTAEFWALVDELDSVPAAAIALFGREPHALPELLLETLIERGDIVLCERGEHDVYDGHACERCEIEDAADLAAVRECADEPSRPWDDVARELGLCHDAEQKP